jgi:hypothetical protein
MFGLIYIMIGLAVLGAHDFAPDLVHTHLPHSFRIGLWAIPGLAGVVLSMDHKWQAIGFALLFIPPAERTVSYGIAFLTGGPNGDGPNWARLPATLIYILILLTVTFVASWPEPTEMQKDVAAQDPGSLTSNDDGGKYLDRDGRLRDSRYRDPDGNDAAAGDVR